MMIDKDNDYSWYENELNQLQKEHIAKANNINNNLGDKRVVHAPYVPLDFDTLQRQSLALRKSGFFGSGLSDAQAIVKVMAGNELGLAPFASMSGIHIVQGKPVLGANLIAALIDKNPEYKYKVITPDGQENEVCILEFFKHGESIGKSSFTIEEAKNANLLSKDNWKKYPSDMLFARAISRGARRFTPGIFSGVAVYTPGEIEENS